MDDDRRDNISIPGEKSKRFGLSYGGQIIGSYDTIAEAAEGYRQHQNVIRPVIDRDKKYRYGLTDGRKEIGPECLRTATKATPKKRDGD